MLQVTEAPVDDPDSVQDDYSQTSQKSSSSQPVRSKPFKPPTDVEETIAQWFEDRPYFYNQADERSKNKGMKNAQLAEFGASIGWTRKWSLAG